MSPAPSSPRGPWFAPLGALTLFAAAVAAYPTLTVPPAAWAHAVLAMAVMPLILTAVLHFTPVLTRGAAPPRWSRLLPAAAFAAGAMVTAYLARGIPLLIPAALLGLAVLAMLLAWMARSARATLGTPHPGLHWYFAALLCLAAALGAMALAAWLPEWWGPLRRFHLHLNLLGFVGLTALGTLRVLLPTVAGYTDPAAAARLRRDLPLAVAGSVLSAAGAAGWAPLAWLGGAFWLYVVGCFLWPLFTTHREAVWGRPGPARGLALAAVGLALNLAAGVLHGVAGGFEGAVALFVIAFLLPLVSGAAGHLVPLWRWPGPPTPAREAVRRRLAAGHGLRGALFIGCGIAVASGLSEAAYLAALLLFHFIASAVWAIVTASDA